MASLIPQIFASFQPLLAAVAAAPTAAATAAAAVPTAAATAAASAVPTAAATAASTAAASHASHGWPILVPIVDALQAVILFVNGYTHNLGWSLVALAVLLRVVFAPLNTMQFKSMTKMQALQPKMKALQAKYKNEPQRLTTEMQALYKEAGTNPFAGCLPLLVQLPVLFSIYQAINLNADAFKQTHFAWVGSTFALSQPKFLAASLAAPDMLLLVLYVVSMYFSVKFSSPPSSDPQQAQTQAMMAIISPLMIAFVGRNWPSGLMLFWLTSNLLQMAQQQYLLRTYRPQGAAAGGGSAPVTIDVPRAATPTREAGSGPRRAGKGSRRSSR